MCTLDGRRRQRFLFVLKVCRRWLDAEGAANALFNAVSFVNAVRGQQDGMMLV